MIFENIEKLKKQYTDKYVVVDDSRPELKRFSGLTGTVKTVNMSGRALVEFDGHNNIGWYDIEPAFLKVVDAPLPKAEEKGKSAEKAVKPATEKPTAKAAPAAKPAAPAAGKSIADILAAARSKPGESAAATPAAEAQPSVKPAPGGKMSMAEILAAARGGKAASSSTPAAKVEAAPAAARPAPAAAKPAAGGKLSMAEILAAARANKGGAAVPPATAASAPAQPVEEAPASEATVPAPAPASDGGSKKVAVSSYAEMIAHCRKVDSKS